MQVYYLVDLLCTTDLCSKNINPTPAAIIFSLEGVIATIAAWFLLSQILNLNNIIGCIFIVLGVLISQIVPELKINKVKNN